MDEGLLPSQLVDLGTKLAFQRLQQQRIRAGLESYYALKQANQLAAAGERVTSGVRSFLGKLKPAATPPPTSVGYNELGIGLPAYLQTAKAAPLPVAPQPVRQMSAPSARNPTMSMEQATQAGYHKGFMDLEHQFRTNQPAVPAAPGRKLYRLDDLLKEGSYFHKIAAAPHAGFFGRAAQKVKGLFGKAAPEAAPAASASFKHAPAPVPGRGGAPAPALSPHTITPDAQGNVKILAQAGKEHGVINAPLDAMDMGVPIPDYARNAKAVEISKNPAVIGDNAPSATANIQTGGVRRKAAPTTTQQDLQEASYAMPAAHQMRDGGVSRGVAGTGGALLGAGIGAATAGEGHRMEGALGGAALGGAGGAAAAPWLHRQGASLARRAAGDGALQRAANRHFGISEAANAVDAREAFGGALGVGAGTIGLGAAGGALAGYGSRPGEQVRVASIETSRAEMREGLPYWGAFSPPAAAALAGAAAKDDADIERAMGRTMLYGTGGQLLGAGSGMVLGAGLGAALDTKDHMLPMLVGGGLGALLGGYEGTRLSQDADKTAALQRGDVPTMAGVLGGPIPAGMAAYLADDDAADDARLEKAVRVGKGSLLGALGGGMGGYFMGHAIDPVVRKPLLITGVALGGGAGAHLGMLDSAANTGG